MAIYAVAFKNYVELREAKRKPKVTVTEFTRKIKYVVDVVWNPQTYQHDRKYITKTEKFKTYFHDGGEVKAGLKKDLFKATIDYSPREGTVRKLTDWQVSLLSRTLGVDL